MIIVVQNCRIFTIITFKTTHYDQYRRHGHGLLGFLDTEHCWEVGRVQVKARHPACNVADPQDYDDDG